VANRNRAETEPIIGFFVNQLVLKTEFSGNPTVRQAIRRAWETALGAYAHQDFPFDFLVKKLNPKRDPSRTPLFSVKFVLQNTPIVELALGDLTIGPLVYENTTAKFDLLFSIQEEEGQLVNVVTYKTELFKPTTIAKVMRHLEFTLETFADHPEMPLDELRRKLDEHESAYQKARQAEFKEASKRKLKINTTNTKGKALQA
jgi:non-ribosomal peptide synthetase component F